MPPDTLPSFPVDDFTLDQLEHALGTCYGDKDANGRYERVGGEFTLTDYLNFMSGYDPAHLTPTDDPDVWEDPHPRYTRDSVIRALIAEVRRLREGDDAA